MTKSKHTKGPWTLSSDLSIWGTSPLNAKVRLLNMTSHSPSNGIDQSANAQLIAAAPEMLEALKDLYKSIKDCPEMSDAMKQHGFDIDVIESMQRAKEAIRKARGAK